MSDPAAVASPGFTAPEKRVIAACAISMLIVQMDWFALNLALPAIARDFNVPTTDLQWVVSGYMLSIGALMVTAGRLADIYGRRLVIVIGLALFGGLSIVCGLAPDENWLITARVVHGVGAALIFPVSIAVVSGTFSGPRQARAIGIVLGFAAIGTALGPFVGGTFSQYASWRGVFFINVPFCLVAVFSALYLQQARGMSPFASGLVFLALSAGAGSASYFSGRLAEHYPADRLMAIGMLISAAGIVGLTSVESLWLYTPLFMVTGVGLGLGWALANVATQAVVPAAQIGAASGITLTSLVMLGAVGVAIAAAVLELLAGSPDAAASDVAGLHAILRAGAALAFAGAIALVMFGRRGTATTAQKP